ncbi:PilW family protein [Dendrosporobacter sp. 1207_IL3150]|uniref:PilW family protein n=1 Tax=Dendrosporobacter sp. 1207_IL3150 TaxID=3084054 RepID=UPI002FD8E49E
MDLLRLIKCLKGQKGTTLVELIAAIMLTAMLLSAIAGVLSTSMAAWRNGTSRTDVQQTARYAVDSIVRDVKFAKSINVLSFKQIEIVTDKYATPNQKITYKLDTAYSPYILRRSSQPVTGGSTNTTIHISNLEISVLALSKNLLPKTIGIKLVAEDLQTGQQITIETAASSIFIDP